jgi:hypothetical protein
MTLALRLAAASILFGGMLVWWALAVVAVIVGWLVIAGTYSVVAFVCGRINSCHSAAGLTRRRAG